MTDICTLILDQHHQMRDRFAELDVACSRADTERTSSPGSGHRCISCWTPTLRRKN